MTKTRTKAFQITLSDQARDLRAAEIAKGLAKVTYKRKARLLEPLKKEEQAVAPSSSKDSILKEKKEENKKEKNG